MKAFKYLARKVKRFLRAVLKRSGFSPGETIIPTAKRARINYCPKSPAKSEPENHDPCHTKQWLRHKSPDKQLRWVFITVEGIDRGRQFIGAAPELKIGRHPESHICLRDPKVSRFHAVIQVRGSQLMIKDLQSTNGTFINEQRIRRHKLRPGDRIKIGDTVLQVRLEK